MGRTACTEPQCLYKCALYLYLYLTLAGTAEQPDIFCGPLQSLLTAPGHFLKLDFGRFLKQFISLFISHTTFK